MKKWIKWSVIIPVLMATLLLALSPTAALAQGEEDAATGSKPVLQGSLAIVAPRVARVGQEISMTVFLRATQEPFEGAGVWALTRDQAEVLREQMTALREDTSLTDEEKDYEALADIHGTFLGRTGADGKLYHTFREAGVYVLVAIKRGYFPGFTSIYVGETPRALAIEAPKRAKVGEDVTMTVYQRGTSEPIEAAGIWALTRDNVELLKQQMTSLREDTSISTEEKDYEALVSIYGTFLGWTDERGQLSHAFGEEGLHVLVAVKRGYFPGFAPIFIGDTPKALAIEAPRKALVGEVVTMTVSQRGTGEPVEAAGIWAITRDNVEALKSEMAVLRENTSITAEDKDYEAIVNIYGIFLGRTDERGQLSHAFGEEGLHVLVAVKRGYFPGSTAIFIGDTPKALAIEAPRKALVGEVVTMNVSQKGTSEPVEAAGIWAITRDKAEALKEEMAALRESASISSEEMDYEALVSMYGTFLGWTDERGQLIHVFNEEGVYLLVTVKRGYFPGFSPIHIMTIPKSDVLRDNGVKGNGLDDAPGLQKPFNENRPDEENNEQNNQ